MSRSIYRAKTNEKTRSPRASRPARQQSGPAVKHADCRLRRLHGEYGNSIVQRLYESGALQAKLKIGRPGNRYEREADSVADRVMAMPEPEVGGQEEKEEEEVRAKPLAAGITPLMRKEAEEEEEVQKQAEEEEESAQARLLSRQEQEEEDVQKQPEEKKEEEPVQAKEQTGKTPRPAPAVESGINAIRGRGRPLPESARAFFEPRFKADFSAVRVHTDPGAAHLARSVKARAFTLGRDLVFGSNQYAPETAGGKRLLAHELTHVVQQRGNRISGQWQQLKGFVQRSPGPWRYKPPAIVKRSIKEIQAVVGSTPDGVYGPRTRDAVKEYQKKLKAKSLYAKTIDGKWGKYTEAGHVAHATGSEAETYNCSGLAFKTFQKHNRTDTEAKLAGMTKLANCSAKCKKFQYKFWYWKYDLSTTDLFTGHTTPKHKDFHIVGGQTDKKGQGPKVVVSKNGKRPVKGPAPPASWFPASATARKNDHTDTPVPRYWKNRTNHVESCYCADSLP